MKVVEYWHGTIKNYRYDGDISFSPEDDTAVIVADEDGVDDDDEDDGDR